MKRAQLIVALDVDDASQALALARNLRGHVEWLKVGLELFTSAGPALVEKLKGLGYRVFLDLKFYDIPNTVAGAVRAACRLAADMLTIHCQGGKRMCAAALEALPEQKAPLLLGVTVLTSFAAGEMPGIALAPGEYGIYLAGEAQAWGLAGVVCSPWEVAAIKQAWPRLKCVCPGIRPAGMESNDQRRVMSPAQAALAGADFLVVGRPILAAANPGEAASNIQAQIPQI